MCSYDLPSCYPPPAALQVQDIDKDNKANKKK